MWSYPPSALISGSLFLFLAVHLSHYQPTPMVTYFRHGVAPPAVSGALGESPALFLAAFCPRIASWNPRIVRSSRSGAQPQSKDYLRAERKARKGRWGGGGVVGRKWRKEGRKPLEANEISPASIFQFFFLSGDTITGASFEETKKIHITQFWFRLSPLSVSVCGLKGSDLCQGINWAKMRLNHKCKVASAATRLCSLVAYQPSPCRHRVTLCLFGVSPPWSAAVSARASRKHRRWDQVVVWVWGLYITTPGLAELRVRKSI